MSTLVLASSNKGKLREIKNILADINFTVIPQSEFDIVDVEETGLSFVENSILKARHASQVTGLPTIADDSGLEVDALDGAPGIYSARYAGETATDQQNVEKLLKDLNDIPDHLRTARFQCLIVFMRHAKDPTPVIAQGSWEGKILLTARGTSGFGYDPVFWVADYKCSAAELTADCKNQISHRAQALQKLNATLKQPFLLPG